MTSTAPLTRRQILAAGAAAVGAFAGTTSLAPAASARPGFRRGYVGAYTVGPTPAPGIGMVEIDDVGQITVNGYHGGISNPFYLALHEPARALYAVSDIPDGRVFGLRTSQNGSLSALNDQPTGGQGPVYLAVHPDGRWLFVANYDSGSVVCLPIHPDGRLGPVASLLQHQGSGPNPQQAGPHPHMVLVDPTGRRVLVPDKGTDTLYLHRFDPCSGKFTASTEVPMGQGVGPRHVVAHPSWRALYVVTELGSTVVTCTYDVLRGAVKVVGAVSIVPPGTPSLNAPSAIRISADGRFLYIANRGLDAISVLAVGQEALPALIDLVPVSDLPLGSALPWDLVLDPGGRFLYVADENSGVLSTFAVNRRTGKLSPIEAAASTGSPVCLVVSSRR